MSEYFWIVSGSILNAFLYLFFKRYKKRLKTQNVRTALNEQNNKELSSNDYLPSELEKPDHSKIDDDVISSLNKDLPFLDSTAFILAGIFIFLLSFSIQSWSFEDIIGNIQNTDIPGYILGFISILVGIITVILVEKSSSEQSNSTQILLKNVDSYTKQIHSKLFNLNVVSSTEDRFSKINEVLNDSQADNHELYMLSYGIRYGQFLLTNLGVIQSNKDLRLQPKAQIQGHQLTEHNQSLMLLSSTIENKIRGLATKGKINIACLKIGKYRHFVKSRILKNKSVLFYDDNDIITNDGNVAEQTNLKTFLGPKSNWNNVFLYSYDEVENNLEIKKNNKTKIDIMIHRITEKDSKLRDYIKNKVSTLNIDGLSDEERLITILKEGKVHEIDYVPFQFFLSIPVKDDSNKNENKKWNAIVIYTDYYNIGKKDSVVSFQTNNSSFCESLKDTYLELVKSNLLKDKNKSFMQTCFDTKTPLKSVNYFKIEQDEDGHELSLVSKDDIKAKDYLIELFKDLEITFDADSRFVKKLDDFEHHQLKKFFGKEEHDYSNMSIGLFHNGLTEYVSKFYTTDKEMDLCNFSFFQLLPRDLNSKEVEDKEHVNRLMIVNESKPLEYRDRETSDETYAIFSKTRISNRWTFVFGAFQAYGTGKMKICFNKLNKSIIDSKESDVLKIDSTTSFICVFKINKLDDEKTRVLSFTTLDNDKRFRTHTYN